jgi:LmbE family N-acetylglucosaminyl deacetylase
VLRLGPATPHRKYSILCLGAHSDDIEIGCGGTLLSLLETHEVDICWVVFSANEERREEAQRSAEQFLRGARSHRIIIKDFRDSYFPFIGASIKESFGQIRAEFSPDLILTHYRNDLHQDHRTISELTWNAFRDHLILEYEIPKYDGDLGTPNLFVHLNASVVREKVRHILDAFQSQRGQDWFDEETFLATLRLRGVESHSPTKYAEAFYCRKIVMEP